MHPSSALLAAAFMLTAVPVLAQAPSPAPAPSAPAVESVPAPPPSAPPGGYPQNAYPQGAPPQGAYPPAGYPPPPYPPPAYPRAGYQPYRYGSAHGRYGDPADAPARRNPGAEEHDGFFLRMQIGPGYTSMTRSAAGSSDVTVSGGGVGFSFALGGAIAPNLILYGELVSSGAIDPEIEDDSDSASVEGRASVLGFGPGLAYYFGPNLFLSTTLAISQVSLANDDGDEEFDTRYGFGVSFTFGKEFWVSDNWGLGAALQLYGAGAMNERTTFAGERATWRGGGINFLFSATFN